MVLIVNPMGNYKVSINAKKQKKAEKPVAAGVDEKVLVSW